MHGNAKEMEKVSETFLIGTWVFYKLRKNYFVNIFSKLLISLLSIIFRSVILDINKEWTISQRA